MNLPTPENSKEIDTRYPCCNGTFSLSTKHDHTPKDPPVQDGEESEILRNGYEKGYDAGYNKALEAVLRYIPNQEGSMNLKGLRKIVMSLQTLKEKKYRCAKPGCPCDIKPIIDYDTPKEHEEHQDKAI